MQNRSLLTITVAAVIFWQLGCGGGDQAEQIAEATTGGSVSKGRAAITRYGCGSCHVIPGVDAADGKVDLRCLDSAVVST